MPSFIARYSTSLLSRWGLHHPEPAVALERAADYIVRHGWRSGGLMDSMGRVCALGAIAAVTRGNPRAIEDVTDYVEPVQAHLARSGYKGMSIEAWNDRPGRTAPEVIRLFRAVAEELRHPVGTQRQHDLAGGPE